MISLQCWYWVSLNDTTQLSERNSSLDFSQTQHVDRIWSSRLQRGSNHMPGCERTKLYIFKKIPNLTHWLARTHSPRFKHFKLEAMTFIYEDIFSEVIIRTLHQEYLLYAETPSVESLYMPISPIGPIKWSHVVYWDMMAWLWEKAPTKLQNTTKKPVNSHIPMCIHTIWAKHKWIG